MKNPAAITRSAHYVREQIAELVAGKVRRLQHQHDKIANSMRSGNFHLIADSESFLHKIAELEATLDGLNTIPPFEEPNGSCEEKAQAAIKWITGIVPTLKEHLSSVIGFNCGYTTNSVENALFKHKVTALHDQVEEINHMMRDVEGINSLHT